jgi:hypothetical protein
MSEFYRLRAYLERKGARVGGNTRDCLLTAVGPAWLNASILTLGAPLSMIIERHERHFSLRITLTAYIVYMIAWCLIPAVLLALGTLPWLGRKATMRIRGATALQRPDSPIRRTLTLTF